MTQFKMKFTTWSHLIIFLICVQKRHVDLASSFCHIKNDEMECSNFSSFDQLNFTELNYSSIRVLKLNPLNLIKLENLKTAGLNLENDSYISMRNINGFTYYLPNDFNIFKSMFLDLDDSIFKFDKINETNETNYEK